MRKLVFCLKIMLIVSFFSSCAEVVTEKDCSITHGTVTKVSDGGVNDAVFHLSQNDTIFYINRALESGFDLVQLKKNVQNKKVTIYYIPTSSYLSMKPIQSQNIYRMDVGGKVLYSEF